MLCPKCGSYNIGVRDTMPGPDGKIYRRRRCRECNANFRTVELLADDTDDFRIAYRDAVNAKSALFKECYEKQKKKEKEKKK